MWESIDVTYVTLTVRKLSFFLAIFALVTLFTATSTQGLNTSREFFVYGVHSDLQMGDDGEYTKRDLYINMGSVHGVKKGDLLVAMRKSPSYNLVTRKLEGDVVYPIAKIKIIHADRTSSIARLVEMLPDSETPILNPRSVAVGDLVRQSF